MKNKRTIFAMLIIAVVFLSFLSSLIIAKAAITKEQEDQLILADSELTGIENKLAEITTLLQGTSTKTSDCTADNIKGTCLIQDKGCEDGWEEKLSEEQCESRRCCIAKQCKDLGGTWVDGAEKKSKCKIVNGEVEILDAADPKKEYIGKICCMGKEASREVPKKPGTWGRLGICVKALWPGTWGEKETSNLKTAAESLEKAKTAYSLTGCSGIPTKEEITKISALKTSAEKLDQVDEINKKITECYKVLEKAKESNSKNAGDVEKIKEAQNKLDSTQDSLSKVKAAYAVTWIECTFNLYSIAAGGIKAGILAFGTGEKEMGSCNPEQPLKGTQYCSSCNEDPLRLCTKERCLMLGNCIPIAQLDGKQYACIEGKCEDLGMPLFKQGKIELLAQGLELPSSAEPSLADQVLSTQPLTINSGKIKTDINSLKPIPFNTRIISINLTTDKPAKCRYILDKKNSSFSEMSDFEENEFPTYGSLASWQIAYVMLPGDVSRDTTHKIYIKCQNSCGVEPKASYDLNIINFALAKKPDELPPEIIFIDPKKNAIISSDLAYVNASFWLDEKGACKFSDASINFTTDYNGTNAMIAFGQVSPNQANSSVVSGSCSLGKCLDRNEQCSRCSLKLDLNKGYEIINTSSEEFNETRLYHLFIRCNDLANNVMTEDSILDYTFMTAPPYEINITKPEENQKSFETMPDIEVTSFERTTQCKYKITNEINERTAPAWDEMTFIDESFSRLHSGKHNVSLEGTLSGKLYTLYALCRDQYGLEARDYVNFIVLKDTIAPILIRAYHDTITGDFLAIETDEQSTCSYSFSGCNFNFSEGVLMTGTEEYIHGAYWKDKTFFIKCHDRWGNFPTESQGTTNPAYNYCTAILKPFDIPMIS